MDCAYTEPVAERRYVLKKPSATTNAMDLGSPGIGRKKKKKKRLGSYVSYGMEILCCETANLRGPYTLSRSTEK